MADIDSPDLRELALDLTAAPVKVQIAVSKVLEVAANKIKKGMAADATGHAYLPQLPNHVSYDRLGIGLEYEIGFEKVGQGNLANIAAFGTAKNAPVMDHVASLRREEPYLDRFLGEAAEGVL